MFTKVLVNGLCDKQTLVNLHNIFQGLIITPLGGGGGLFTPYSGVILSPKRSLKNNFSGVKITPDIVELK